MVNDVLEIRAVSDSIPRLTAVCLRFGIQSDVTIPMKVYEAGPGPQSPLSYPLAPQIERWLRDGLREKALRSAPRARLPVDVLLVNSAGAMYETPLTFDLSALWSSGSMPLRVTDVRCEPCKFDGKVTLIVPELSTWKAVTNADPEKLTLLLDGVRVPAAIPVVSTAPDHSELTFRLQRQIDKPDSVASWNSILKKALSDQPEFKVALANDKGLLTEAKPGGTFDVHDPSKRLFFVGLFAFFVAVAVVTTGDKTQWRWVRDSYGIPDNLVPDHLRSFSLGRSQMLWWTIVIAVAWFAIGFSTGDWMSINESCLILLGISVGTAVGAMVASPEKMTLLVKDYEEKKAVAKEKVGDAAAQAAWQAATAVIVNQKNIRSSGFVQDLVSDYGESAGLHRLQNLMFTAILGGWFIVVAFREGGMPTLSTTMLTLMGISGSAYVGFKMAGK
ncbi:MULTISPECIES: hypothetical protein [unclassified Variovorax]|uniref:hypothetical protein n=1 Tax=unclassified Variovorax TaxID=663243 RepID=UPI003F47E332